ncbi:DnaJ domain-containing protein, partial [Streptomyces caeruleatus]
PDKNNGDDKGFAELAKAYEVLSDPERRKKYDETGDSSSNDATQVSSIIANLTVIFLDHEDVKTKSLTEFIKKATNEQ